MDELLGTAGSVRPALQGSETAQFLLAAEAQTLPVAPLTQI